eukprot:3630511-Amphidinium_carterae.2
MTVTDWIWFPWWVQLEGDEGPFEVAIHRSMAMYISLEVRQAGALNSVMRTTIATDRARQDCWCCYCCDLFGKHFLYLGLCCRAMRSFKKLKP